MRTLGALLSAIFIPLMILNLLGGFVGGIWLAIAGEWYTIFLGLLILLVGAFAVSLLLMPGLGLAVVGVMALERGNKRTGWFFILLSSPWTPAVIFAWQIAIFMVFGNRVTRPEIAIPIWLWSYGAATGVWTYLATKESQSGGGETAFVQAFGAQVAYIVLSVCYLWLGWSLVHSMIAMAIPLLLPLSFGLAALSASRGQDFVVDPDTWA